MAEIIFRYEQLATYTSDYHVPLRDITGDGESDHVTFRIVTGQGDACEKSSLFKKAFAELADGRCLGINQQSFNGQYLYAKIPTFIRDDGMKITKGDVVSTGTLCLGGCIAGVVETVIPILKMDDDGNVVLTATVSLKRSGELVNVDADELSAP